MKCARDNCARDAVALPELQIPAEGFAFDAAAPMSLTLALPLCSVHGIEARQAPDQFITPELRDVLDGFTRLRGLVAPDYDRARIVIRRIEAPELAAFVSRSLRPH